MDRQALIESVGGLAWASFTVGMCVAFMGVAGFGLGWTLRGHYQRRDERQADQRER